MAVQTELSVAESLAARVQGLVSFIQQGQIIEALEEFYHPEVQMQENNNAPTVGLPANLARERQFISSIKDWKYTNVESVSVDPKRGRTLVQYNFEFVNTAGQTLKYDQVAVQTWRDGKVVHEKFYYNAAA